MTEIAIIDVGKSGTRIGWRDLRRFVPGVDPAGSNTTLAHSLAETIRVAVQHLGHAPTTLFVGTTALPTLAPEWRDLARHLRPALPNTTVHVMGDSVLAHAACLGGPGVVASVGTGTVVSGFGPGHPWRQWDGWGPDLGDRGSAFAIGREALRIACRHVDGLETAPGVLSVLEAHLGHAIDFTLANALARSPSRTSTIADLARAITASDEARCRALTAAAARDITDTCALAAKELGVDTVGIAGALGRSEPFNGVLEHELNERGLRVQPPLWDVFEIPESVLLGSDYEALAVTLP